LVWLAVQASSYFCNAGYRRSNGKNGKDAAIVLGVIAGIDNADAVTKRECGKSPKIIQIPRYTRVKGKRLGVDNLY
jgi:hypothetical protein